MPELPEVETIKRTLYNKLINKKITECEVYYEKCIKTHSKENFKKEVQGTKIENLERRGKYLKLLLNTEQVIMFHLRMTGRLYVSQDDFHSKHTHVVFSLADKNKLIFNDIRKFGTIYLLKEEELNKVRGYALLGPEPFGNDFTLQDFKKKLSKRKKNIKNLLLDQETVAGIGNIYADEILFAAGISPLRIVSSLQEYEMEKLYYSIKSELQKGIENRGTSFSDYVDGEENKGENQNHLNVYGRKDLECKKCGTAIEKKKLGGRGSYYCPGCQK